MKDTYCSVFSNFENIFAIFYFISMLRLHEVKLLFFRSPNESFRIWSILFLLNEIYTLTHKIIFSIIIHNFDKSIKIL